MQEHLVRLWLKDPLLCVLGFSLFAKVVYDVIFVFMVYKKTKGTGILDLVMLHREEKLKGINIAWIYNGYLVYSYSWYFLLVLFILDVVFYKK